MQEYFEYLTDLRDSGTMNMMWAPTMLQADFDLDKKEAREIFSKWCESLAQSQPSQPARRTTAKNQKTTRPLLRQCLNKEIL